MKPLLIWPGKKTWLVPYVKPLWDKYKATHTLVEPFGGSLAMSFGLEAKKVLASDTVPGWKIFHKYLRAGQLPDKESIKWLENTKEAYLAARTIFNNEWIRYEHFTDAEAAEYGTFFYFLNRMCFSGHMRVNSKGRVNAPYGYRTGDFSTGTLRDLAYLEQIRHWEFLAADAYELLNTLESSRDKYFIFADPPYHESVEAYSRTAAEYDKQIAWSHALAGQKCPVIACNAPTDFITGLYRTQGFTLFLGSRKGAGFKHDKRKQELIMLKNFSEEEMKLFALERVPNV